MSVPTDTRRREATGAAGSPGRDAPAPAEPSIGAPTTRGARPLGAVVAAVGIVVTAGLAVTALVVHRGNEEDILAQRAKEVGLLISTSVANIRTPLLVAAELAETTDDVEAFTGAMVPLVGEGKQFTTATLWTVDGAESGPLATVGTPSRLAEQPPADRATYLQRARDTTSLAVLGAFFSDADRRVGYGVASARPDKRYVVYAELLVPPNPRAPLRNGEAYSDLGYAVYLGTEQRAERALLASTVDLPFDGAVAEVDFGDARMLVVVTAKGQLGGVLLGWLPWLIAIAGLAVTAAATVLTQRLQRRREHAEGLALALAEVADENGRLYAEQRTLAQRLQQSLLPKGLPTVRGIDLAARYEPGVDALDIGGDWYDLIHLADGRLLFVVGDVSGRGLDAAALMASLRYATRAYAAEGDDPSAIVTKLGRLLDVARDGHFATMLCGVIDVERRAVTIVNAGHPDPLVIDRAGEARYLETKVAAPVGVTGTPGYAVAQADLPPGATLLAFTDGLYERRDETVDVSLERVRRAAAVADVPLDTLLTKVLADLAPWRGVDDTALLGVRWQS